MTTQEAKKIIKQFRDRQGNSSDDVEALDMAIKALETTEQVNTSHNGVQMFPKGAFKAIYEDNEDCINREQAIRVAEQGQIQGFEWQFKKLCALPSVIPKAETEAYNKGYTDAMRDIGDTQ